MSLRRIGKLSRVATKVGLASGTVYLYYDAGLWKSSDETIQNYDKLKNNLQTLYDSTPTDFQKWVDYAVSTTASNVEPYKKSVSDFREQYLSFDFSYLTEEGDGIVKPTWNKGVSWTFETLKDSPDTLKRWGSSGWKMVSDLATDQKQTTPSPVSQAKQ